MFKGVELYSWRDVASGQCRHSLLPGTNRNKHLAEITAADTAIVDMTQLKKRVALLAEGEQVVWSFPEIPDTQPCPSRDEVDALIAFAAAHQVTVRMGRLP